MVWVERKYNYRTRVIHLMDCTPQSRSFLIDKSFLGMTFISKQYLTVACTCWLKRQRPQWTFCLGRCANYLHPLRGLQKSDPFPKCFGHYSIHHLSVVTSYTRELCCHYRAMAYGFPHVVLRVSQKTFE